MKKILLSLALLASVSLIAATAPKGTMDNFRAVPPSKAELLQDGKSKMYCPVCGMTLPAFYRTNHAAQVDGVTHQYCSIHCMHEEAATKGKEVVAPQVVDNDTLKFMDASAAFYVVGSKKPGTMSPVSKYAFSSEDSAKKFAKEFGGTIMGYAELSQKVKADLGKEIAMIQKKQAQSAMMGEKVYKKMCKPTDKRFANAAEAKTYIMEHKLCGELKGPPLQQVGLYLSRKSN